MGTKLATVGITILPDQSEALFSPIMMQLSCLHWSESTWIRPRAVSGQTQLLYRVFHSAICTDCSRLSLIRNSCVKVIIVDHIWPRCYHQSHAMLRGAYFL